ncbi:MAG: FtsX-like permease family protein [Candidatus Acidiferrum sp.]|jgi:predicted permease
MIRSLGALWKIDPGFNPRQTLTFGITLPPALRKSSPPGVRAALRQLNEELESLPGVTASSLSWGAVPMSGDDEDTFWIEGQPKPATENEMSWALSYVVQEDYLEVMQTALLRGRFLTRQDNENSPHVAVVDEVFARQYFPGQDPIGRHVFLEHKGGRAEIVGVVAHVKQWGLDTDDSEPLRAELYSPYMQLPDEAMDPSFWSGTAALVRFAAGRPVVADSIRQALKNLNSDYVVYGPQTMDEVISDTLATRRVSMILLGIFAALAVVLASVGIYGVISYLVGQRTQEIAVRVALGAQRRDVLQLILGQGMRLALSGLGVGMLTAFGVTRLMSKILYGVSATDPGTFLAVGIVLMSVALLACYLPARRAMRVDPVVALRFE